MLVYLRVYRFSDAATQMIDKTMVHVWSLILESFQLCLHANVGLAVQTMVASTGKGMDSTLKVTHKARDRKTDLRAGSPNCYLGSHIGKTRPS